MSDDLIARLLYLKRVATDYDFADMIEADFNMIAPVVSEAADRIAALEAELAAANSRADAAEAQAKTAREDALREAYKAARVAYNRTENFPAIFSAILALIPESHR